LRVTLDRASGCKRGNFERNDERKGSLKTFRSIQKSARRRGIRDNGNVTGKTRRADSPVKVGR